MNEDKKYLIDNAFEVTELTPTSIANINKLLNERRSYAVFANDQGLSKENHEIAVRAIDIANLNIKLILGL